MREAGAVRAMFAVVLTSASWLSCLIGVDEGLLRRNDSDSAMGDAPSGETGSEASLDPYVGAVLASGPVAYYPLDEATGTVAHDRSGNGNACAYEGAVVLGAQGFSPSQRAVRLSGRPAANGTVPGVSCAGAVSTACPRSAG